MEEKLRHQKEKQQKKQTEKNRKHIQGNKKKLCFVSFFVPSNQQGPTVIAATATSSGPPNVLHSVAERAAAEVHRFDAGNLAIACWALAVLRMSHLEKKFVKR